MFNEHLFSLVLSPMLKVSLVCCHRILILTSIPNLILKQRSKA